MTLLTWAIIFFVISLIAGAFGFTGVASGAKTVAKVLFGIFLILAIIVVLMMIFGVSLFATTVSAAG